MASSANQIIPRSDGPNILHVGSGETYGTLSQALAASQDGDTIQVDAGTYLNDNATVSHSVTIEGVGGMAHLQATQNIPNGKAILIDDAANLTIKNMEFSGAQVSEGNGAGIRYEAGNLVIQNSFFHDNQDGILSAPIADGHATIDGSTFIHNGAGDGQTHGAYFGMIASLTVTNSIFQDQFGGSDLKSRAATNLVEGNAFVDSSSGQTNYQIDFSDGGTDLVAGNIFNKSADANNRAFIHFGGEVSDPSGALIAGYNQFTSAYDTSSAVLNQTSLPVTLTQNSMDSDTSIPIDGSGSVMPDLTVTGQAASPLLLLS